MYLKSLTISNESQVIRKINFRTGINLIVDETPASESKVETGNNVGKTTVLKLIDFCFGADAKSVYIDNESKKEYQLIKDFLKDEEILVELVLKEDLNIQGSKEIVIVRNFLSRKKIIRRINGQDLTEDEFEPKLGELIFPNHQTDKPSFRQIISHNFRYDDEKIAQTLKTLNRYTSDAEYETLHLFLLGCEVGSGNEKQKLLTKIQQENTFKNRLEKKQTKTSYETTLALVDLDIEKLNRKKASLNLNENFESDLDALNKLKYQINKLSSEISRSNIRRDIILEAKQELEASISNIDTKQLQIIYQQATKQLSNLQKTFEDLLNYHNKMVVEKVRFITQELPTLEADINNKNAKLSDFLKEEKKIAALISKSDSFEDLESLISELNEKFRKKGEYEQVIQQLNEIETELEQLNNKLQEIDNELFSDDFEQIVKNQRDKFNKYFSSISNELYGEQYALNYDIIKNSKGQKLYKFSTFNTKNPNMSSGKKQGEISCFDIAYILFADNENIPSLHFILNDKKELMHGNQLNKIAELANEKNIQFIASILQDKLPVELDKEEYFVLKLSQSDKLFRVEKRSTS